MVTKVYRFLTRGIHDLHQAAYVLGLFALFSQILALARDRIFAHMFGASETLDVYYAAFRIPDLLYVGVASMVSLSVLVPFLVERAERNKEEAQRFVNNIFTIFALAMVAMSAVLFIAMPYIAPRLFPGFEAEAMNNLILLTRILLVQPFLLGFSSLLAGVTQAARQFAAYSLSLVVYNIGIIIGAVFLYPVMGIAGLGLGVILGALMHAAIQLPAVLESRMVPRFTLRPRLGEAKEVLKLSLPRTIALSGAQIVLLVLISLATLLEEGSVAVFTFAYNLQSVPLTIIGVSYSVAAFPTLASAYTNGKRKLFVRHISSALKHILFWALPATALFIVLRAQIVRVILGSGEFSWSDTRLTAANLALFAISLVAHALVLLFVRGYYAAGKTLRPLIINVSSSVGIIVLAFGFLALFRENDSLFSFVKTALRLEDIDGALVVALPLAYTIGFIINAVLLWIFFVRDFRGFGPLVTRSLSESVISSVALGAATYYALIIFAEVFNQSTLIGIFLQGLSAGIVGITVGIVVLELLGSREIREIRKALHSRFWKKRVIPPDSEV